MYTVRSNGNSLSDLHMNRRDNWTGDVLRDFTAGFAGQLAPT